MNEINMMELSFNADTCGALEGSSVARAKVITEVVRAAAKIITELLN